MLARSLILKICLILGLWSAAAPAMAQYNVADNEDVIIAFFKTAGTPPNFETLAKSLDQYYLTPVTRQKNFIASESNRLRQAYDRYDPATGLLTIRTMANLRIYAVPQEDGQTSHGMTISFGKDDTLYFPYALGDYNIAVLPQKMGARFDQNLAAPQYDLIKQAFNNRDEGKLPLYIQLKPVKAYLDQPYKIGGIDQWALITDVAGLMLAENSGRTLWTYNADWYVSPMTDQLRTMYDDQADEKQRIMDAENPVLNAR